MSTRTKTRKRISLLSIPFRIIAWIFRPFVRAITAFASDFHAFFTEEVDDSPVADALNKVIDQPQDLLYHLDALRRHLLRGVLVLLVTTAISARFFDQIMAWLSTPLPGGTQSLQIIEVTEPISVYMRVALFGGFALAFPYIALELWLFIGPGVARKTRVFGLFSIPIATIFFLAGVAFAYYIMLPVAIPFLLNIGNFKQDPRVIAYVKFVTGLMFWIGLSFEYPLVIYFLARLGIVSSKMLREQWRLAVVIIAVVAAVVTPTVDPVNMGIVMSPLIALYILSIFLAFIAQPKQPQTT